MLAPNATTTGPTPLRRRGFSILEAQVAFVLLGIGLAGVCPLIVMQVKLSKRLAAGFEQNGQLRPGGRTFLVMQPERWARKLGAAAALGAAPGGPATASAASHVVTLLDPVPAPYGSEAIRLRVARAPVSTPAEAGGGSP